MLYLVPQHSLSDVIDATNHEEIESDGEMEGFIDFDKLDEEVDAWCAELALRSPTAIALAKRSMNADTDHIGGIGQLGFEALRMYYDTEESQEGVAALKEKRTPDFTGR